MAPIVDTYRSGEAGLFVNSYLVEGTEGVVAIDAPLRLSDGRAVRARLDALRTPLGVLVTHPERYLPGAPLSWLVAAGPSTVAAELAQQIAPA